MEQGVQNSETAFCGFGPLIGQHFMVTLWKHFLVTSAPPSRGPKNLLPALCAGSMKLSVPIRNEAISPMILAIIPLAFQAYLVEGFLRSPIPRVAASRGCPLGDLGFRNLWPPMTQDSVWQLKIAISVSGVLIQYVY